MKTHIRKFLRNVYFLLKKSNYFFDDLAIEPKINKKKYGSKNPDKHFCIIRPQNSAYGAFAQWQRAAYQALFAESLGLIPVFDFQHYKSSFWLGEEASKDVNWWDLYFRQYQNDYDLNEVYQSSHVYYIREARDTRNDIWLLLQILYKEQVQPYCDIYKKIGVKKELEDIASNYVIPPRTCGIPIRRSMEWGNKVNLSLYTSAVAHHQRGTLDDYVKWIDNGLKNHCFDYFFVASDDQEAVDYLKKIFNNKCLFFDRKLPYRFSNGIPASLEKIKEELAKIGMVQYTTDYIIETVILSKCDTLLSIGTTSQSKMPSIISGNRINVIHDSLSLEVQK